MSENALFGTVDFQDFNDYKGIRDFAVGTEALTFSQFEKAVINDINLFAMPQDYNFQALNAALDEIIKALPYIKNISAHPITHIKNEREILPVEAVRSISNETVSHISVHSELWQNITDGNLRPRKLLSQNHIDNYAIYENVIFTRLVDYLLSYINRNIAFLNNILYSNQNLHFNLLERENHPSYFLALGKLHTGYVRNYSKYSVLCESCIEKLKFVNRVLKANHTKQVFKYCKKVNTKLTLRKTNIFRNDKDYGRIYKLIKYFSSRDGEFLSTVKLSDKSEGYFDYCVMIALFGMSHFNFTFPDDAVIDFNSLNVSASFKDFKLQVKTPKDNGMQVLKITVTKDIDYSMILIPEHVGISNGELLEKAKQTYTADEFKLLSGFDEDSDTVLLSLFDVESFRKIQQLVLKAMVYADQKLDYCPFCGESSVTEDKLLSCKYCRTEIKESICPKTQLPYKTVEISNLKINRSEPRKDALMHFRNITAIAPSADIICPKCGQIHKT